MLVQTKNIHNAIAADFNFDIKHPKYSLCVQRLACKKSQVMTVTFNGQLSQFQAEEESVQRGHPVTNAMENDLAEVLLGLFIPWDQLPVLFQQHAAEYETKRDACAKIWNIIEPTLSLYNYNFASNIQLLRKSKEEVQIDAALCKIINQSQNSINYNVDKIESAKWDLDNKEAQESSLDESLSSESLIAAYHSIARSWYKESLITGQGIPTLQYKSRQALVLQLEHLLLFNLF